MLRTHKFVLVSAAAALVVGTVGCTKQNSETAPPGASSPAADARPPRNPLKNAYFGDMHLHSSYSMDAFALGTRTGPDDAYKYAMGETVVYFGNPQKRIAPLDFLALTDHAEYLGVGPETIDPNGAFAKTDWFTTMTSTDPAVSGKAFLKVVGTFVTNKPMPELSDPKLLRSTWNNYTAIANKYNQPGKFTSFVAFEWTSAPQFQNLHRCVIFADKGPEIPFSSFDSQDPEALWRYLEEQRKLGLDVIAVPHNGNASNGLMFRRATCRASLSLGTMQSDAWRMSRWRRLSRARGKATPARRSRRPTNSPTMKCGCT